MPVWTLPGRPELFFVDARHGAQDEIANATHSNSKALRVIMEKSPGGVITLCRIPINDIVERRSRSCVVHLMCVCYIQTPGVSRETHDR
jgi:hypothetical protein